jgi:plasmid stability protein
MAEQTITLTLPDDLYRRFQEHAALKQRSLEEEVLSLATSALAEDQLPRDIQQAIADLTQLDDASLWQTARTSHLTQEQSEAIEELLFKQQREGLAAEEKAQLEQLRHEHDKALLVRARAIGLLQDRGQDVKPLFEQP